MLSKCDRTQSGGLCLLTKKECMLAEGNRLLIQSGHIPVSYSWGLKQPNILQELKLAFDVLVWKTGFLSESLGRTPSQATLSWAASSRQKAQVRAGMSIPRMKTLFEGHASSYACPKTERTMIRSWRKPQQEETKEREREREKKKRKDKAREHQDSSEREGK